ncbi:hypothetical protein CVT26_004369 [Gymnopilus dilepis]|uniref:Uncharacterized protein n=1 Tax=Gymnopilus dilepis TaxID=231916 RepID=A0A409YVE3_9AGAR|nr:hypothetical protein CVT26_004369 [Gymnopilus dilepis]
MLGCPSSPQPSLSRGTIPDTTTPSITPELLLLCLTRGFLHWWSATALWLSCMTTSSVLPLALRSLIGGRIWSGGYDSIACQAINFLLPSFKQNCGVEAALNIMTGSSAMVRAFFPPRHVDVYLTLHFFIFRRFAMALHTTSFSPFNLRTGAINIVACLPIFMSSAPRHYKTPFPAVSSLFTALEHLPTLI